MPNHEERPPGFYNTHRVAARVENARWLLSVGTPLPEVAKRLGVSVACIQKDLARSAAQ